MVLNALLFSLAVDFVFDEDFYAQVGYVDIFDGDGLFQLIHALISQVTEGSEQLSGPIRKQNFIRENLPLLRQPNNLLQVGPFDNLEEILRVERIRAIIKPEIRHEVLRKYIIRQRPDPTIQKLRRVKIIKLPRTVKILLTYLGILIFSNAKSLSAQ